MEQVKMLKLSNCMGLREEEVAQEGNGWKRLSRIKELRNRKERSGHEHERKKISWTF